MAHETPDFQVWGEVKSESVSDSCTDDDNTDTDHLSQRSHDNQTEQELSDPDSGDEDLFETDDDKNTNVSTYLTSQNQTKWSHVPQQSN